MALINWDDDSIKTKGGEFADILRFRAKRGQEDIIRILDAKATLIKIHWVETAGRYYRCTKDEFGRCPLCDENVPLNQKFNCNIYHWGTGKIMLWTFGDDKFNTLKRIKKKYGSLVKYDLSITTTDHKEAEKFQKLNILPELKSRKITKQIVEEYKANRYDIEAINKVKSPEEIESELELASPTKEVEAEDTESLSLGHPSVKPEEDNSLEAQLGEEPTEPDVTSGGEEDEEINIKELIEGLD